MQCRKLRLINKQNNKKMEYLISPFEWFFIGYTGLILIAIVLATFGKGKVTLNKFNKPKYWILPILYVISIFVHFLN